MPLNNVIVSPENIKRLLEIGKEFGVGDVISKRLPIFSTHPVKKLVDQGVIKIHGHPYIKTLWRQQKGKRRLSWLFDVECCKTGEIITYRDGKPGPLTRRNLIKFIRLQYVDKKPVVNEKGKLVGWNEEVRDTPKLSQAA